MPVPPDNVGKGANVFQLSVCLFVRSSGHILLLRYLINALKNFDITDREYSLASIDDLTRFWRSKVKVTAGRRSQVLWMPYLMNYFSNLDENYRE